MAQDNRSARPALTNSASYAALVLFALLALYPIVQLTRFSLSPGNEPRGTGSGSFGAVFSDAEFMGWLLNSAVAAVGVALASVLVAWMIAKLLSRVEPRNGTSSGLIPTMFAAPLLLLPIYAVAVRFGLTSPLLGAIIIFAALTLPFCIWQLKTAYDNIPASIEEAALIDGCSRWQVSRLILLPLLWPAVAASALFSLMSAWTLCVFLPLLGPAMATSGSRSDALASDAGIRTVADASAMLLLLIPLLICLVLFARYVAAVARARTDADCAT